MDRVCFSSETLRKNGLVNLVGLDSYVREESGVKIVDVKLFSSCLEKSDVRVGGSDVVERSGVPRFIPRSLSIEVYFGNGGFDSESISFGEVYGNGLQLAEGVPYVHSFVVNTNATTFHVHAVANMTAKYATDGVAFGSSFPLELSALCSCREVEFISD